MGGAQSAASYDAKSAREFNDAGEHILHIFRHQLVSANDFSELHWRTVRNIFVRAIVQHAWMDRSPIRQVANIIELMAYKRPTMLSPYMKDAVNAIRKLNGTKKGEDKVVYNLSDLKMTVKMARTYQAAVSSLTTPTTKYPQTILGLSANAELHRFLDSFGLTAPWFIDAYFVMHQLWDSEDFDMGGIVADTTDAESLASVYFKQSYQRWSLEDGDTFGDRAFIATVYGYVIDFAITFDSLVPSEEGHLEFWDIYEVRRIIQSFADDILGSGTGDELWIDGLPLPKDRKRPANEGWHKSFNDLQKATLTSHQQVIATHVAAGLRKIHQAANSMKIWTVLPASIANDVFDDFQNFSEVSNFPDILGSAIVAGPSMFSLWLDGEFSHAH